MNGCAAKGRETATRRNRDPAHNPRGAVTSTSREFAAGSIETKTAAIGRAVPREEWETIPRDYLAKLEYYQFGPSKG